MATRSKANDDGPVVPFPRRFTQIETAEFLGFSTATLARERERGRIRAYIAGARKVYYLENEIMDYLNRKIDPCVESNSSRVELETTGSPDSQGPRSGTELGLTEALGKRDAKASALKILSAPMSCSHNGSPSTSSCDVPLRKT
jgi:hypothetical protein